MSTLRFKTSMKCGGCVSKVTPSLNGIDGIKTWKVDFTMPQSTLEVETDENIGQQVIDAVKKEGYNITAE